MAAGACLVVDFVAGVSGVVGLAGYANPPAHAFLVPPACALPHTSTHTSPSIHLCNAVQAAAAQLSSKLTLLAPATLLAVLDAFVTLGCPPDQQWVLQAAAAIAHGAAGEGLTELTATQLQRLLALLVTLRVAPPVAWLDRAAWAVQQTSQAQQRVQAADDDVGSADCEDLLSQLREMQQQQKEEVAKQSSDGPKASAAPEAVAKVQPGS